MAPLARWLSLVKFSHSIFALPFALQGAWLARHASPPWGVLGWIVLCAVAARTAAMGFNRLVDRRLDAENPRTRARELPAGLISAPAVGLLVACASALFVWSAFQLNPLCGRLSLPVLAVLLAYSLFKRFSWTAHFALGLALALAPLGAWLAVRGELEGELWGILALALAVLTWVAGFDLIYACQDAEFDRASGLHSIPARFGIRRALRVSKLLHVATIAALACVGWREGLGWIWAVSVALAALLLVWEHRLVKPDDLSRVNAAFFTVNGWIGVGLFLGLVLDLHFAGAVR